jgi:hypothetical protein
MFPPYGPQFPLQFYAPQNLNSKTNICKKIFHFFLIYFKTRYLTTLLFTQIATGEFIWGLDEIKLDYSIIIEVKDLTKIANPQ